MVHKYQQSEDKKQQTGVMWGQLPQLPTAWDCCLYPRVSTTIQTYNVSAELQVKEDGELWDLAQRLSWKPHQIRHPKEDMALSGRLRMEERPAFKQMLTWIINGEVRAIIAVNVDRLFRDKWGTEYSKFMEICEKYHVVVVTPEMVYDFSDSYCIKSFRDKCIQAWEYLEYQVYKRMVGAKEYLGTTGRWAGGNLPPGYIPDRNKKSPTFRKFIIYTPWEPIILRIFERYRELNDGLMALQRELDAKPFVFPDFEPWVDEEIVSKVKMKKVPGGYILGLGGIAHLLTNPVYIGWWLYDGALLVDEQGLPIVNHDPIVPLERQEDLFWHTFRQRSRYNIDGTKNTETIGQRPRRYNHLNSPPCPALLKKIVKPAEIGHIVTVVPQYNAKSFRTGKFLYTFRKRMNGYTGGPKYMLATDMVDDVFWNCLMGHLWETQDFDAFAVNEHAVVSTVEQEKQEIGEQIAACERKLAKLMKRLTAVDDDEEDEESDDALQKKIMQQIKSEMKKFEDEKVRLEERLAKLADAHPETYAAQMVTYRELLQEIGTRAKEIYTIEELYEMVETFTAEVVLDTLSPRIWKIAVTWRDPAWGKDEIVCFRTTGNPSTSWSREEREILAQNYSTATRRELIEMLPNRSWVGIRTISSDMKLRRHRDNGENEFPYDICYNDWLVAKQYNLPLAVDVNNMLLLI